MGASNGNTNAEKWNLEEAESLLDEMIEATEEEDLYIIGSGMNASKVLGYKHDFIGELTLAFGVYHELVTRDIPKRHPSLKTKSNHIIRLMERNCYSNTKKGIIKTAVGIVNLKSNHKWTERVDNTTKGEKLPAPPIHWNATD